MFLFIALCINFIIKLLDIIKDNDKIQRLYIVYISRCLSLCGYLNYKKRRYIKNKFCVHMRNFKGKKYLL